jgi:hypothetical protein
MIYTLGDISRAREKGITAGQRTKVENHHRQSAG